MIIGLTGKNGSGKGEIAETLKGRGFRYFSLSDVLRDELKESGSTVTRENLIRKGQELRESFGPAVLAERTRKKLADRTDYIVDSFRHPKEVEVFRKLKGFKLWCADADPKIRFERCLKRARENEPQSFEEFIETERLEFNTGESNKQDLLKTIEQADVIIENNSTVKELREKVKEEIKKCSV